MWTRQELKTKAKEVLRKNYWRAFLVSLVLALVGAGYSNFKTNWSNNHTGNNYSHVDISDVAGVVFGDSSRDIYSSSIYTGYTGDYFETLSGPAYAYRTNYGINIPGFWMSGFTWTILFIAIMFMALLFAAGFRIFVGFGLEVGGRRYFINAADDPKTSLKALGLVFKSGKYFNVLSTMFLRALYTFLWTLLFIIPGIIKAYEYAMIPYILADNPGISTQRAFELSKEMTNGHKWEMFVLSLSFIGWYILGAFFFGIGVFFVYPYENATKAELYIKLRDNTINSGFASCDELCLYPVYDYIDTTTGNNQ